MDDVSGLLAFISLIAAQFLAVVVAHAEGFDNDPPTGQRFATCVKRAGDTWQKAPIISSATCFADADPPAAISHCTG
jgi:hypothetical protein